ncbi:hypothetical protein SDC9_66831 [bioreactor metagenome]|uniref:Uncharacterized protein n=1 Tax=bioreactor metagenome TaxID=1076179 RepID=A0A644XXK7_9ZZZZ
MIDEIPGTIIKIDKVLRLGNYLTGHNNQIRVAVVIYITQPECLSFTGRNAKIRNYCITTITIVQK